LTLELIEHDNTELINQIRQKSFLCIGLDVDLNKIPKHLLSLEDPIFELKSNN
jgi:hypothetical protein